MLSLVRRWLPDRDITLMDETASTSVERGWHAKAQHVTLVTTGRWMRCSMNHLPNAPSTPVVVPASRAFACLPWKRGSTTRPPSGRSLP
jgi:hypothetical protein